MGFIWGVSCREFRGGGAREISVWGRGERKVHFAVSRAFFLRFSFFSQVHFLHFFHFLLKWLFSTHPRLVRDHKPFHFTHEQEDQ